MKPTASVTAAVLLLCALLPGVSSRSVAGLYPKAPPEPGTNHRTEQHQRHQQQPSNTGSRGSQTGSPRPITPPPNGANPQQHPVTPPNQIMPPNPVTPPSPVGPQHHVLSPNQASPQGPAVQAGVVKYPYPTSLAYGVPASGPPGCLHYPSTREEWSAVGRLSASGTVPPVPKPLQRGDKCYDQHSKGSVWTYWDSSLHAGLDELMPFTDDAVAAFYQLDRSTFDAACARTPMSFPERPNPMVG